MASFDMLSRHTAGPQKSPGVRLYLFLGIESTCASLFTTALGGRLGFGLRLCRAASCWKSSCYSYMYVQLNSRWGRLAVIGLTRASTKVDSKNTPGLNFIRTVYSAIFPLNSQSGSTAMAQLNLSRSVFEKTLSIGTSFRLHQATEIRGSM